MATYVNIADAINRIRALLPNIGNIYFVDTDAGVNAANRGTYALPLKTIDYTISNYVTDYNGDVVICWGSAGGDFDENVNVDGVQVDKNNTAIIGFNMPKIDNSNGGATSIFHVTAQSCRIWGFACTAAVPIIGIHCDGLFNIIGNAELGNSFEDCSVDVQLDGNQNLCEGNRHRSSTIGYLCTRSTQEIRNNIMLGTGAGGSMGVSITATIPSIQNYIHDNDITGYDAGISDAAGAVGNAAYHNSINCTLPIADLNASGLNNWDGNYINTVKTTTDFTYLTGTAERDVFTYGAFDTLLRRIVGSIDFSAFTAAKVITVRIYETIAGAGWQKIKEDPYTVGTTPNPHFDYTSFVTNKITMQINVTEAAGTAVPRKLAVKVDE